MIAIKVLVTLGLLSLARSQEVFNAYSPGQYGGSGTPLYRGTPTPRLVPVKVTHSPRSRENYEPTRDHSFMTSLGQRDNPHFGNKLMLTSSSERRQFPSSFTDYRRAHEHDSTSDRLERPMPSYRVVRRDKGVDPRGQRAPGRHIRITQSPFQHHTQTSQTYSSMNPQQQFYRQSGEPIRVKRIRVAAAAPPATYAAASPSPYALNSPVTFRHTQPAVATYRPQPQSVAPVAVSPAYQAQQPVPQYYRPQPQAVGRPAGLKPQFQGKSKEEELEAEYPSDPNPQYNFAFDVKDDDFTNYQNRQETKEGGITKGSYSVVDPDGYVRTVTYEASPKGGFKAKVTREPTDVKIKFPVPTEAPEQDVKGARGAGPAYSQGQPLYQHHQQPQYYPQQAVQPVAQPQYVSRGRFPVPQHRLTPQYQQ